jgi:hypothetical protein
MSPYHNILRLLLAAFNTLPLLLPLRTFTYHVIQVSQKLQSPSQLPILHDCLYLGQACLQEEHILCYLLLSSRFLPGNFLPSVKVEFKLKCLGA